MIRCCKCSKEVTSSAGCDCGSTRIDAKYPPRIDHVNHPPHYKLGNVEVINAIEAWNLDFRLANVIKYVARAGKKYPDKKKKI